MTDRPPPNWDQLQRRERAPVSAEPSPSELLCAQVFASGSGKELLRWMRSVTIDARSRPGAPEAELRELEAVRRFVMQLEQLRDRGLETLARKAKS